MLPTTLKICRTAFEADQTLSPADRSRLVALLRNGATARHVEPTNRVERLIRRREVAERISCSLRTVDKLAATGILAKRKLPGRTRASGFLESDVVALITAKGPEGEQ
jgi:predicted DNA-binding transcriptional regulator AlpA